MPGMSTSVPEANTGTSIPELRPEEAGSEYPSGGSSSSSFAADLPVFQEPTEADAWDKEIQEDAKAGKLDALLKEARKEHREGTTQPLP